MRLSRTAAAALGLCLLGLPAAAKTEYVTPTIPKRNAEAMIVTMNKALQIALNENLTVLTARQEVERAKGQSKAAQAALNPSLSLQGQGNAYDMPNQADNEALAKALVSQTLYSGGKNSAAAAQGRLGITKAEQSLSDTRESVASSVWNAFCEVLYRKAVLRSTANALDYYVNAEKELKKRVEFGLSTNLDLTRIRQQKENARAEHISAGNNLESARVELCRLLRLPPDANVELVGERSDGLPKLEDTKKAPEEGVLERILERRGDYQALKTALQVQKKEITIARSGMSPTLSLSGGYRFGYTGSGTYAGSSKDQWSASLTLDVPLYDGGSTSGNLKAAKAGLTQAENALLEKEEAIKAELADNWLSLQNALEALSAGRQNLKLAQESLRYAESGYKEGVNTQLDVLQARSDLTAADQKLAGYLRDSRVAQANLWKVQGLMVEKALSSSAQDSSIKSK